MRWFLKTPPFSWLYLLEERPFFLSEQTGSLSPGKYVRVTLIPTPGGIVLIGAWLAMTTLIGLVLAIGVWSAGAQPLTAVVVPAAIIGVNAAIRFVLKLRERLAAAAAWDQPVGRMRPPIRILAVLIGVVLGGLGGFVLIESVTTPVPSWNLAAMTCLGAVVEGIRNGLPPDTRPVPSFDRQQFTHWLKRG